jgi:hypothetical protein
LFVRADAAGHWYGKWREGGRQVKRKIGPKHASGTGDSFTRAQAERERRRLMDEIAADAQLEEVTLEERAAGAPRAVRRRSADRVDHSPSAQERELVERAVAPAPVAHSPIAGKPPRRSPRRDMDELRDVQAAAALLGVPKGWVHSASPEATARDEADRAAGRFRARLEAEDAPLARLQLHGRQLPAMPEGIVVRS